MAAADASILEEASWDEVDARAAGLATELRERGATAQAGVAHSGPTSLALVVLARACLAAGVPLTVLPRHVGRGAGDPAAHVLETVRPAVVSRDGRLEAPGLRPGVEAPPAPDDDPPCIVQMTSGSTGVPDAIVVRRSHVAYQAAAMAGRSRYDVRRDHLVSWLPMYHDMGLVAFLLTPMVLGLDLTLADPSTFVGQPLSWPRLMGARGATVTAAPQFAYSLLAGRLDGVEADLSPLRVVYNGAEPVHPDASRRFAAGAARRCGFDPGALLPVYGLAEATLAVSIPPPGSGVRTVERRGHEEALLGPPLDGTSIRVVPADRGTGATAEAGEDEVGEVEVAAPGVADRLAGGERSPWLATGDLGYLHEGELVIVGRLKELIIVGGQNIAPHLVEEAARTVPGVRPGGVAAVGLPGSSGTETIAVVAETREPTPEMSRAIAAAVEAAVGVRPGRVDLVEPGTVPKTTSGKIRRRALGAAMGGDP